MFVIGKPRSEAFTAHQLTATEADGRNGRATMHTSGNDVAHMRFRAMQQLGNRRQRQQPKIIKPIHKNFLSYRPLKKSNAVSQNPESFAAAGQGGYRPTSYPVKTRLRASYCEIFFLQDRISAPRWLFHALPPLPAESSSRAGPAPAGREGCRGARAGADTSRRMVTSRSGTPTHEAPQLFRQ